MPDQFCIRDNYKPHSTAATVETSFGDYWVPGRIAKSMDYQWHVYRAARDLADRHALTTVGDFGCGVCTKLDHFLGHLNPAGFDQPTTGPYINEKHPRVRFGPIDLENPPEFHESFDLTICSDVLEHLLDPDPAMALLRAATKRFCVLSTPERDLVRGPEVAGATKPEHVREWNKHEFASFVQSRGFTIVSHDLVPQERLKPEQESFVLAERAGLSPMTAFYHGCQLVVCTPA